MEQLLRVVLVGQEVEQPAVRGIVAPELLVKGYELSGMRQGSRVHLCALVHEFLDEGLDPPDSIGGEAHPPFRVETFQCLYQSEIAFLDDIEIIVAAVEISPAHVHDEHEVRLHYLLPGCLVALLVLSRELVFLLMAEPAVLPHFTAILIQIQIVRSIVHRSHPFLSLGGRAAG